MNIFFIEDLRSTNGTFIGDDLIEPGEAFQVDERDTITIGNTVMNLQGILASSPLSEKDTKIYHPKMHIDEKERLPLKNDRRSPSPKEQEFISRTSELLKQTVNINEILNKAAIVLFDNQKVQVKRVIARSREDQGNGTARFSKALLKQVARDGKAIKLSNVIYESPGDNSNKEQKSQTRSVLCVPMIRNSKIRGGIYVDSNLGQHDGFRKEDHLLLHRLSRLVGSTIEKASLLLN
jgi:pSer/pThr/pTyr-binding forkhead associated (FHA) protein